MTEQDRKSNRMTRLAVYGSLAPGRSNHQQLDGLAGRWRAGVVRGALMAPGWRAGLDFPGVVLDPGGGEVAVQVFESPGLPGRWARLDAFEGPHYRRVVARVRSVKGEVEACIYVARGRRRRP